MPDRSELSRRQLVLGGVALAGLAACSNEQQPKSNAAANSALSTEVDTSSPAHPSQPNEAAPTDKVTATDPINPTAQPNRGSGPTSPAQPTTGANPTPPTSPTLVTGPTVANGVLPPPPQAGSPALFVDHGARTGDAVSLTYHASGDPALTIKLLDLFRANNVTVTVFAVGQWLTANPDLGRRIVADGHELANHTLNHKSMGSLTAAIINNEIAGCGEALTPFIGSIGKWFRPSGIVVPTAAILAEAGKVGYAYSVGYDVDTLDYQDPGVAAIVANLQRNIQPGSIVSMHFGHQGTIDATPKILDDLDSRGLRHVTLGTLLT